MDPDGRIRVLQRAQALRAELREVQTVLGRLRESAWPEEQARATGAETFTVAAADPLADAAHLLDFLRDLTGGDRAEGEPLPGGAEDELRALAERGLVLICRGQGGGGAGAEVVGCCAVKHDAAPAGASSSGAAAAATAPRGSVAFLAVRPAARRRGVGARLLEAAEERLAAACQCGEVEFELRPQHRELQGWLAKRGYTAGEAGRCTGSRDTIRMAKTLPLGFVSRSLMRDVAAREQALSRELAALEVQEREAEAGTRDASSSARRSAAEPMLTLVPQDVWKAIASCLGLREIGTVSPSCRLLAQETGDPELWHKLFLRTCWPPSPALLEFAEGGVLCPADMDWRAVLSRRAEALPVIVVDVGRGYTKYGVVHGVAGRPEGDGAPPAMLQLCSSPTHPPDCSHNEQISSIQRRLNAMFIRAAANPADPLHHAALAGNPPLRPGGWAVLRSAKQGASAAAPPWNRLVRVVRQDPESGRWEVQGLPPQEGVAEEEQEEDEEEEGEEAGGNERGDEGAMQEGGPRERAAAAAPRRRDLRVPASDLVGVRQAQDLPLLVGEPFAVTANRRPGRPTPWAVEAQLVGRPGPVRIAPQAQMSLWAHGIDHGIVVNIGQGQTIALPVVRGEIAVLAAEASNIGSGRLTQMMLQLLRQRLPFVDDGLMTWCRDLKERYCYVAPPACATPGGFRRASLRSRLATGDHSDVHRVTVAADDPVREVFDLGLERVLVPEALFDSSLLQEPTVPEIVVRCAEGVLRRGLCTEPEAIRALLRNIVLVGGAADIPGVRPRTEHEVRDLLHSASAELRAVLLSPDDAYVLNPPLGASGPLTSPRFAPFFGGCVRAAGSQPFFAHGAGGTDGGERQANTAADAAMGRVPMWVRRRLFDLDAPAVFRTGGGGGEDDITWVWARGGGAAVAETASASGDGEDDSGAEEEHRMLEEDDDDDRDEDREDSCDDLGDEGRPAPPPPGQEARGSSMSFRPPARSPSP